VIYPVDSVIQPLNNPGQKFSRKRSFIPTVGATIRTNPSRKLSLSKTLLKLDDLKTPALCFRVGGKHLKTKRFENDDIVINAIIQTEFSSNTNAILLAYGSVDGQHSMKTQKKCSYPGVHVLMK